MQVAMAAVETASAASSVLATTSHRWRNSSVTHTSTTSLLPLPNRHRTAVRVHCTSGEERTSRIDRIKITTVGRRRRYGSSLRSSSADAPPPLDSSETWLLQPVGDGESSHIGVKVPMPGSFEIVSDVVTVGRLPDKASLVIPVATVSGLHARLERKKGRLLVTDLSSTNGTFVGEKKLPPGATVEVLPGSNLTFGDANLAMFRVSKLAEVAPDDATAISAPPTETKSAV